MDNLDDGDSDENQLQACFVLHRGLAKSSENGSQSSRRKGGKKGNSSETKRGSDSCALPPVVGEPSTYGVLRWQAFNAVWGRIQKLIEDIVEGENQETFNTVQQWICNRQFSDAQLSVYHSVRLVSNGLVDPGLESNWSNQAASCGKQLHTALVFLGGINLSDHRRTFDGLKRHLNAHKCHVASLTSIDFVAKAGVGGPLRSLFRQLIRSIPETTDMEILAAWHRESENQGLPIAVVVEDPESCDPKTLAEFFALLSEWIEELPIVLIMGMATAEDAIRRLLPASTLARLHLCRFTLRDPQKLLELIIRAVLVEAFCAFELSREVVRFLYGHFENHDLSITSIMRSLKIACVEHFWKEPMSFLCGNLLTANSKVDLEERCASFPNALISHVNNFPSVNGKSSSSDVDEPLSQRMASSLWQLRHQKKMWAMVFQCLSTLGKYAGVPFGDLFCAVLQWVAGSATSAETDEEVGPLEPLVSKLRDMPGSSMKNTLEEWRKITLYDKELNADVSQILSEFSSMSTTSEMNQGAASAAADEKDGVQTVVSQHTQRGVLLSRSALRREHVKLAHSGPFHEVFCFKDVSFVKQALVGDTRRGVHLDLLNSSKVLKCDCCPADGGLSPTLHDTTLAYMLSQEYGDLVRVHTWFQAFAAVCDFKVQEAGDLQQESSPSARQGRSKKFLDPKVDDEGAPKRKRGRSRKSLDHVLENGSEEMKRPRLSDPVPVENAPIQARFMRAATELQIVGLLQMPKKGNSETVRRICI